MNVVCLGFSTGRRLNYLTSSPFSFTRSIGVGVSHVVFGKIFAIFFLLNCDYDNPLRIPEVSAACSRDSAQDIWIRSVFQKDPGKVFQGFSQSIRKCPQ